MQFSKLKLTGFKSFVDPTELLIEPGMTGIVGPNGCGKSNLVEALRWVMGESSAKQMRGSGMDDVIFNGTSTRPKRNLAEVVLTLENDGNDIGNSVGQPALNDVDIVAVSRRIEREKGSGYKLNGADIRARDVQLLFADHASGARSPALVSQGRVGAIINAKPADRRKILEDAAGVSGLHSRRHEAELRLRAALGNLQRLEDVTGTIETQLNSLLRQARQARRYNSLNDAVRRLDALRLYIQWMEAVAALNAGEAQLQQAEQVLAEATRRQSESQRQRDDAIARLPGLRTKDAEMRAKFRHIADQRDAWQQDLERRDEKRQDAALRAEQISGDRDRERRILRDAEEALVRLDEEKQQLLVAVEAMQDEPPEAELEAVIAGAADQINALEAQLDKLLADMATLRSQYASQQQQQTALQQEISGFEQRSLSIKTRLAALVAEMSQSGGNDNIAADIEDLGKALASIAGQIADLENRRQTRRVAMDKAEQALSQFREDRAGREKDLATRQKDREQDLLAALQSSETAMAEAGETYRQARNAHDTAADEITALKALLSLPDQTEEPVLASLTVADGYEQALAVALDSALQAPVAGKVDKDTPFAWRDRLDPAIAVDIPVGTRPLSDVVTGNAALDIALSMIFVLEDGVDPQALQPALPRGAMLVSRDGGMWRHDGFMVAPGAPSAAAQQIARQNRLRALEKEVPLLEGKMHSAEQDQAKAAEDLEQAKTALQQARHQQQAEKDALQQSLTAEEQDYRQQITDARQQESALQQEIDALRREERDHTGRIDQLRNKQAAAAAKQAEAAREQAVLDEQLRQAKEILTCSQADLEALPDLAQLTGEIERLAAQQQNLRDQLSAARQQQRDAESARDQLLRDASMRQTRLVDIMQEYESRDARRREAEQHLKSLDERFNQVSTSLELLAEDPQVIAQKQADFDRMIEAAQADKDREAANLAEAESRFIDLDTALKDAGEGLATARENRIRAEAGIEQARQNRNQVGIRIAEDLESAPHELWKIAEIEAGSKPDALQPVKEVETELDRMKRQRDAIGPVNLRAEVEAEELKTQMGALLEEKADLEQAIDKLKEGIDELNAEGRARLLTAFEQVDSNFGKLFKRLFGGGRAHLTLIESDDPLNAGLEIMASPPGKRLTTLSLLSGGEQALTATALLFGVFLTNPAPICVLDEVDAPLDDANTERFATLIEEIVRLSGTRFLVVTHNPLTMSRMNRLYGVTMTERGVSQMLSVDLERAEELVDDAAA